MNSYRKAHPVANEQLSVSERARLRELERENQQLRMQAEFLKKSSGLLHESPAVRFAFIHHMDAEKVYSVVFMCRMLKVSRSAYYDWKDRPLSAATARRERLKQMITAVFEANHGTYGYRRVHAVLVRSGEQVSAELVRDLMRELDLWPCQPRPWRPTTTEADADHRIPDHRIPDLVDRDFTAEAPGTKLVGDITYIPTGKGWVYLATVIDCDSKMVIGWSMADHYKTSLIVTALDSAAGAIEIQSRCVLHSDRGSNYTSNDFAATLAAMSMQQSAG